MKHVFLTFVLFAGLAMSNADAQSCNKVCPPGCCIVSCCTSPTGAAAVKANGDVSLSSCSPEALSKICGDKKMSKKEMKACQAACEASRSSVAADQVHVAPVALVTPTCLPACQSKGNGKEGQKVAAVQVKVPASKPAKS